MTTAIKYVGIDVHQSTLVIAVQGESGALLFESTVATREDAIKQVLGGLSGRVRAAFEEGAQAQWLYDVVQPLVDQVVVCNPREARQGNKSDEIDAKDLATKLRLNALKPVYHQVAEIGVLKEFVRLYECLVRDGTRSKLRLKAIFRGRAIPTPGEGIYDAEKAEESIKLLTNKGATFRARSLLAQIAKNEELRAESMAAMVREGGRHRAYKLLKSLPFFGPVRSAQLLAVMVTPHRFRTKRQVWTMAGLSVISHSTSDKKFVDGKLIRSKRAPMTRGLNRNHNRTLKEVFVSAAQDASRREGPLKDFYEAMLQRGLAPEMAKLTLARKIAAYTLRLWKKGEPFDPAKLTMSTS
jgi:transposase